MRLIIKYLSMLELMKSSEKIGNCILILIFLLTNFQQVSDIFIRILFQDILLLQRSQTTQAILGKSTMTKKVIILLMVVLVKVISYPFFVIIPSLNHITTRRVTVGVEVNDFCPISLTQILNNNT